MRIYTLKIVNLLQTPFFRCKKSGKCIPLHLKCSGANECDDGSDESDECETSSTPNKCNLLTEFDCGHGRLCLPMERVCDRVNDCGNWEDEPKDVCR